MIQAVNSINFGGVNNFKPQKNIRKVLNSQDMLPKGLTKPSARLDKGEKKEEILEEMLVGAAWSSMLGGLSWGISYCSAKLLS